ncbi:MAG: hypothetical protein RLZZ330_330 [Actinomycetota bacterium]|jgi:uncharacterized protein with FMN-binding domain
MKRGLLVGGTAVVGALGSFMFPAGAYTPELLVGEPTAPLVVNPTTTPNPNPSDTASSASQSRTLVGDTVQTRYGPVQIQVNVTGTTIDSVDILQVPTGQNARFTNYSIPILIRETLKAQSANIANVSGASYTSMGYTQSLQSALAKM